MLVFMRTIFLGFITEVEYVGEGGVDFLGSVGFVLFGWGVGHEALRLFGAHQLRGEAVLGDGEIHLLRPRKKR